MNSWLVNKRVAWFSRLLFLIVTIRALTSCASYGRKHENPSFLNSKNIAKVEGTYNAKTIKDSIRFSTGEWHVYHHNFLRTLDRNLWRDTLKIDTTSDYSFKLVMKPPSAIHISYIKNDTVFREQVLKTKFTKKGYLQLKNKNLKFVGLPYIFGAHDQKRIRLTVDADNNLIVDKAEGSYGAIFLIFGGSSSFRQRLLFLNRQQG